MALGGASLAPALSRCHFLDTWWHIALGGYSLADKPWIDARGVCASVMPPLTLEQLRNIQAESMADDVPIDVTRMACWSELEAREFFESGGAHLPASEAAAAAAQSEAATRALFALQLGACIPNAPIPVVPLPVAPAAADAESEPRADGSPSADAGRIFCVSDIHSDHEANMAWCAGLRRRGGFERDVLLVAGDVASSLVILQETLEVLTATFGHVFYVPGNHDLWVKGRGSGGLHIRPTPIDSLQKLEEIRALCERLGVRTRPGYAAGALLCPLFAWYHASWDSEPEIVGWKGIPEAQQCMMDFHLCEWPEPLSKADDSIARRLDEMNDRGHAPEQALTAQIDALRREHPDAPLLTFSHFVPRLELNPEKRFLFFPPLSKACGSDYLRRRIDALRPAVHVYGHTHFGWDATLDGVRYLQAPLAYPEERKTRLATVATGVDFPHGDAFPVLAYDAVRRTFPPRYDAGWSNFYAKYPRCPDLCHLLPPYVAANYQQVHGVGAVGWLRPNDNPTGAADGAITPAWALGPANAVTYEKDLRHRR